MNQPHSAFDATIPADRLLYLEGLERCLLAGPRLCPHCGQPMIGSTPAAPVKDANVTDEPPPSGWRDREPLL